MTGFDFRPEDFGAAGNGITLDTAALQATIEAAAAAGGGRVVLRPGSVYLSGSLRLRSHVELHLPSGTILKASSRFEDFDEVQHGVVQIDEPKSGHSTDLTASFVFASDCVDVAITGRGVIDGNGRAYVLTEGPGIHLAAANRVFTVHFRNVAGVHLHDVRIEDASLWTVRLSRCDDVVVRGVTIRNDPRMPNSDGIDIDACRRVRISDCDIVAGDDAICLKAAIESTRDGRTCEQVTITNCTLSSSSTAILCGVECDSAIRDVLVSNCVIHHSNRGLAVSLRERGVIERVRFENIVVDSDFFDEQWWGNGEPIYVSATARHARVGRISEISFSGITARGPRGIFVWAADGGTAEVSLTNIDLQLTYPEGGNADRGDLRPRVSGGFFADRRAAIRVHGDAQVRLRAVNVADGALAPIVTGGAVVEY